VILLDVYDTDFQAISAQLSGRTPIVLSYAADDDPGLGGRLHVTPSVWIVRNTRDISPRKAMTRLQAEACAGRAEQDTFLDPYASWERTAMRIVGHRSAPACFYQLTVCGQAAQHPPGSAALPAPSR